MNLSQLAAGYANRVFGLDLRSLAVMRVGLASVILVDLAIRACDFSAMYVDDGIASVEFVRGMLRMPIWSLHLINGSAGYQAALFVVAALLAVALLVGYHTRLATIACWIMVASIQLRLPLVTNAGDTMLRVFLFWSMFLPLGAVWSLDARRRGPPALPLRFVSVGTVAFIIQLATVYWFAGWAKWNDAWLQEDALGNIFKFGFYGLPLGAALVDHPALTRLLSQATVWFEVLGPLLLFIPWQVSRCRAIAIIGFVLLHVGIAVTMTVGLFSYVAIAVWMAMLPTGFWSLLRVPISAVAPSGHDSPASRSRRLGRRVAAGVCWAALAIAVYWNVANEVSRRPLNPYDGLLRYAAHVTTLRQSWGVFGRPPRQDSWFVYQARLKNGEQVDLLSGGSEILANKPPLASRQFANHRWRKLHHRLRSEASAAYRQPVADYMRRQWNATHGPDEQVVRLDFYLFTQSFDLTGNPGDHARKTLAQIVGPDGGNFAEALRGDENF